MCACVCVHKSAPSLYGHTVLTMSRSKAEQGQNFNQPLSEPGWLVEVTACMCVCVDTQVGTGILKNVSGVILALRLLLIKCPV